MKKPNKKQDILLKWIKKYIFTNANILRNQEIILCAIHHTYRLIIYWSCLVTTNSSRLEKTCWTNYSDEQAWQEAGQAF